MVDDRVRLQLEHALAYLQQGWHLVFMNDGEKGPKSANWNAPSELVTTPAQAVDRLKYGAQNMGLCHQPSGTMALDVDNVEHTRFIFDEMGLDYDDILGRGMRIRSKAGRDKVVFRCPDMPLVKVQWPTPDAQKTTDRMTIVEFRAGPSQDVLPPSKHPDGHLYEWWPGRAPWDFDAVPEIPAGLLQLWQALADRNSGVRDELQNLCPWKKASAGKQFVLRARKVSSDHQDVIGKFNAANNVGDMLEAAGYKRKGRRYLAPTSSTTIPGVVVLEDRCYSHHGSDVLADGYAHDAFDLLCVFHHNGDVVEAIRDAAQQLGIDREAPHVDMQIDMGAVLAAQAKRRAAVEPAVQQTSSAEPEAFAIRETRNASTGAGQRRQAPPAHLLRPPGVLGQTVDWMLQTSVQPQPELAVAATIAAMGTVLGHRVMGHTRARTNFYLVGIANSGAGKDHARKAVKRLLIAAGMKDNLGGEELGSGPGVLAAAARCPNSLFLIDEFGDVMKTIGGSNAASHERSIMTTFTKLFTSADAPYLGTEYANQKDRKRVDIMYPCVSFYATTVPSSFYPSLNSDNVASGWLNRMIVVTAPDGRPAYQDDAVLGEPPQNLVEWVRAARAIPTSVDAGAEPMMVPMHPMGKALITQFRAWIDDHQDELRRDMARAPLAELWARSLEQALKLALVVGVCKTPADALPRDISGSLEIDIQSVQWAIDYIRYYTLDMEREVGARVGDSENDRIAQDVLRIVRRAEETGYTIADLNRLSRPFKGLADKRKQQGILELLQVREDVVLVSMTAINGRRRDAWVAAEFAPKGDNVDAA